MTPQMSWPRERIASTVLAGGGWPPAGGCCWAEAGRGGERLEAGAAEQIRRSEKVQEIYLGTG